MHMADALISTPVAVAAGAVAVALIAVGAKKVRTDDRPSNAALMGVLGAFVFAAQMVNFAIPGTGSSGHIIGGLLLASVLGSWRGFITLCSVLIVQCLVFADGGLAALGCNIINMGAMSCLVAYPLVFRPLMKGSHPSAGRLMLASVLASVVGLELGAFLVSVETVASGVTALPMGKFLAFMLPIHLAIGICEGVATGLVLAFVAKRDPQLLATSVAASASETPRAKHGRRVVMAVFAVAALVLGVAFVWIASENPDGLEWSIMQLTGAPELAPAVVPPTALMPDYGSHLAGIVGGLIVMVLLWALTSVAFRRSPAKSRGQ